MEVRYNKGMGCPVEISDGKTATCISLDTAKKLQASLLAVIEQAEMPEEEMSEFEKGCIRLYQDGRDDGFAGDNLSDENLKECSAKLLALAREQFIKDGYVIEKKAFHDAVEKVAPEVMKEVSDKVDMEEALRLGYENGRAAALKDFPRWKRIRDNGCVDADGDSYTDCLCLLKRGWYQVISAGTKVGGEIQYLSVSDLEKLPGFKEDEK